jgi:hypothetical protein
MFRSSLILSGCRVIWIVKISPGIVGPTMTFSLSGPNRIARDVPDCGTIQKNMLYDCIHYIIYVLEDHKHGTDHHTNYNIVVLNIFKYNIVFLAGRIVRAHKKGRRTRLSNDAR